MEKETDIRFQLGILRRDGYHAAARIIESLQGTVSREAEMEYLKEFARQSSFDVEISRDQFRCLWTAYCLHHGLDKSLYLREGGKCGCDRSVFSLWKIANTSCE